MSFDIKYTKDAQIITKEDFFDSNASNASDTGKVQIQLILSKPEDALDEHIERYGNRPEPMERFELLDGSSEVSKESSEFKLLSSKNINEAKNIYKEMVNEIDPIDTHQHP